MFVDPDGLMASSSYALMGMGGAGMSGWANPQSAQALASGMAAAQRAGYDPNMVLSAAANAEFSRNVDRMAETYVTTTVGLATIVYAAPAATFGGPQLVGAARTSLAMANNAQLTVLARVANAGKMGDKAYMGLAKGIDTLAKTPPGSRIGWIGALSAAGTNVGNWIDSAWGGNQAPAATDSFLGSNSAGATGRK